MSDNERVNDFAHSIIDTVLQQAKESNLPAEQVAAALGAVNQGLAAVADQAKEQKAAALAEKLDRLRADPVANFQQMRSVADELKAVLKGE